MKWSWYVLVLVMAIKKVKRKEGVSKCTGVVAYMFWLSIRLLIFVKATIILCKLVLI